MPSAVRVIDRLQDLAESVTSLGVVGDGSTNDLAAIQAAFTTYAGVRPLYFPPLRYRIGSGSGVNRITMPSGLHVVCAPGAVFEINAVDNQSGTTTFYAAGTDGTKTNMTGNVAAGAQTVTLPTGLGAGFTAGDLFGIECTTIVTGSGGSDGYAREIRMVTKVTGDILTLDTILEYAYTTAATAQFWKITPVKDIVLERMRFESGPGVTPGTDGTYPIQFKKTLNCRLADIELHNMIGGVVLFDAYDTLVDGLLVNRVPKFADSYGYGIWAAASTTNLVINGLRGRETRHLFTTISDERAGPTYWGGPMHVEINGAIGYGAVDGFSIFDTHEFGRHIHFNGCIASGGGASASGYQMRAQDIQLNNCRAIRCGLRGAVMVVSSKNVQINGGEYAYCGSEGIALNGANHRVGNARVHNNGAAGISCGATTCTDPLIRGCDIYDNTLYGVQDGGATGAARPVITGNNIPKSTAQTTAVLNLSATGVSAHNTMMGYGASTDPHTTPQSAALRSSNLTDGGLMGGASLAVGNAFDSLIFRSSFRTLRTDGYYYSTRGLITANYNTTGLTSAQIDTAVFPSATPIDGAVIGDATNNLILIREGGKWYKTAALTQIA